MRAKAAQRKLKKRVRKHKRATSEARWETNQAYVALGNLHTQMEQVDQQRAATQEARADDQAMLVGQQEQLEAAHAEAFTATCQRILANNRVAMVEAEQDRTRLERIVGLCREGLVPAICIDPEHGG